MRLSSTVALAVGLLLCSCVYTPPAAPIFVSFADSVCVRASATFELTATAPGNRGLFFVLDWGDGQFDTTLPYSSGDTAMVRHVWQNPGEYRVKARSALAGEPGRASAWADPVSVTILANGIPAVPHFTVPERVVPNGIALFRTTTTDPDGDSVAFLFDFGSMTGGWTGLVPSGDAALDSHRYGAAGTFRVRCKAKDGKDSESDWSGHQTLTVGTEGAVLWWWQTETGGSAASSPVIVLDRFEEIVYTASDDGAVYGITGHGRTRHKALAGTPTGHPVFSGSTGHLFISTREQGLTALTLSLIPIWRRRDSLVLWQTPAVSGNRVYIPADNDTVYAFTDLGLSVRRDNAHHIPGAGSAPAIDRAGFVYVGTDSGRLYKMPADLAAPVWARTLHAGDRVHSLGIGVDGTIYCGTGSGRVFAVAPTDGSIRWTALLDGEASPVVVGSTALFVGTASGRFYSLRTTDGSENWSRQLGAAPIVASPMLTGEHLYCQNKEDVLYCLHQSDGRLVWTCRCADYGPGLELGRNAREARVAASPTILSNGNIIVIGRDAMYCVAGSKARPLSNAPWPKWQADLHNTGKAR